MSTHSHITRREKNTIMMCNLSITHKSYHGMMLCLFGISKNILGNVEKLHSMIVFFFLLHITYIIYIVWALIIIDLHVYVINIDDKMVNWCWMRLQMPLVHLGFTRTTDTRHSNFGIAMRPRYLPAIVDVIKFYEWKGIIYLYQTDDGMYNSSLS